MKWNWLRLIFHKPVSIDQRFRDRESILLHAPSSSPSTGDREFGAAVIQRWNTMTDYPAVIPLLAIQRLRCPKCQTRMRLAQIWPGPTGFELRTFDCSKCDYVEKIAIASDPMKSGDVGWLMGELRPPT
jgi:hypothetical protein